MRAARLPVTASPRALAVPASRVHLPLGTAMGGAFRRTRLVHGPILSLLRTLGIAAAVRMFASRFVFAAPLGRCFIRGPAAM